MTDAPDAPTEAPPTTPDLPQELNASLCSVWARYTGSRPSEASVAVDGSIVRWTVPAGTASLEAAIATRNEERDPGEPGRTRSGYERETSAAVSKVTRRPVQARITKKDKATGAAIESFVLEAPTPRH